MSKKSADRNITPKKKPHPEGTIKEITFRFRSTLSNAELMRKLVRGDMDLWRGFLREWRDEIGSWERRPYTSKPTITDLGDR